ncbi:MAG: hypothetical protein KF788_10570 [Piscinibacter sp.]|nr:hypothetical protein [Piscinibacter sp.]
MLLLHAAALWLWLAAGPPPRTGPAAPAVAVRLLPWVRAAPTTPPVSAATRPAPPDTRVAAPRPTRVNAAPSRPPLSTPQATEPTPTPRVAEAAALPASAAPALPPRLDSELTARAIRDSARRPGLAAQAGRVGPADASPADRLGAGIARGAQGDCLKGEYLGAGMGVLSLPFLAAAALREQCRR